MCPGHTGLLCQPFECCTLDLLSVPHRTRWSLQCNRTLLPLPWEAWCSLFAVAFCLVLWSKFFVRLMNFSSIPSLLKNVSSWISFFCYIKMVVSFLCPPQLIWWITLIDFQMLSSPCIPGINLTWLWFFFFFFFVFLGPHLQHMEFSRLGSNWSCSRWPMPQPQ